MLSRLLDRDEEPAAEGERGPRTPHEEVLRAIVDSTARHRGTAERCVVVEPDLERGEVWNRCAAHARGAYLRVGASDDDGLAADLLRVRAGESSVVLRGARAVLSRTLWRRHPFPHVAEPLAPWLEHLRAEGVHVAYAEQPVDARQRPRRTVVLEPEPLRILHVVHGFPPESHAGTEIACQTLAQAQRAAGHVVRIFARSADPAREEYASFREEVDGLVVDRVVHHLHHRGGIRDTFVNAAVERVFRRTLVEFRPDVVHVHHLIHLSAPILALARRSGAVTGVTWHDYWPLCPRVQLLRPDGKRCRPRRPLACLLCVKRRATWAIPLADRLAPFVERPLLGIVGRLWRTARGRRVFSDLSNLRRRARRLQRLYAGVDFAFAPSRHLAELVSTTWSQAPTRVRVIENALVPERFERIERRPASRGGPLRLGFLGSLVAHKGLAVLLEALRGFAACDVVLHVHGVFDPLREAYHAELERLARGLPVVFHGRYENDAVAAILGRLDVLCLPSLWAENSPIVRLEAAAVGIPVLAPRLGGLPEKVTEGVDGWLYDPGRGAADLRRALGDVLGRHRREEPLRPEPRLRTAGDQAAEIEVYYRLARRERRGDEPRVVAERWGAHADALEGAHEVQGTELLLLRPDRPGVASYSWTPEDTASEEESYAAEVEVELLLLGGEHDVPVGGRVYFNDRLCEELTTRRAGHRDELRVHRFPVLVNGQGSSVRIENVAAGRPVFTRVRRVRIVRRATPSSS